MSLTKPSPRAAPRSSTRSGRPAAGATRTTAAEQPADWYKDAVIYEVHVRAFADHDGDGIGDFKGLTSKLGYLQDLGVTAIWILPFYPSPGRDDGYDIADYTSVNRDYGTLTDVKALIREAHRRGIRVITELVCNHTSDQHPWFQRARRAKPGSAWRDFYVWSDSPELYKETRIIFKDFETSNWTWDPVAGAYYWHRFYSHQPDLNFDNPRVKEAVFKAMDFWLDMGVDGLRLDAIPYLYEREGTNCENLPETHAFLRELRRHVDDRYKGRMLLAEANQWPEDSVAYFGDGDECNMAFHFPVMPRMFMAVRMEDRYPIVDILEQTPAIPESAQWALFLRNHDELTLEMVTDEERDYMYRVYASDPRMRINLGIRRRLAPLLGNHRRRIELLNGLLFALPGTPVLYYGDEIGMGDNIYLGDRNGVRTPMQWSGDRNAGFSSANSQRLFLPVIVDPEYHYETVNVEAQQNNPHSLLWWTKRLIALRKRHQAFGRGTIEFLQPENRKVLAFVRRYRDEQILIVANLSRFVQHVDVDLSAMAGLVPVEMFGRVEFPAVGKEPYFLTLSPHSFYWFSLEPSRPPAELVAARSASAVPVLGPVSDLKELLAPGNVSAIEALLPSYLVQRRWFRGKARRVKSTRIVEVVPVPIERGSSAVALVEVDFTEGDPDLYAVPMTLIQGPDADTVLERAPHVALAVVQAPEGGNGGARGGDGAPSGGNGPSGGAGNRAGREGADGAGREGADGAGSTTLDLDASAGEGAAQGRMVLIDAMADATFCGALLELIASRRKLRGRSGILLGTPNKAFRDLRGRAAEQLKASPSQAEQSNSSVRFGDRLMLKMYRQLEPGVNPEVELGTYLTEREFKHVPGIAGTIEYRDDRDGTLSVACLQAYVPNEGDAWHFTLDAISGYLERAASSNLQPEPGRSTVGALLDLAEREPTQLAHTMIEGYLDTAWLLGVRTGEMHKTLASNEEDLAFAPEQFTPFTQRSLYQSVRNQSRQAYILLRRRLQTLPPAVRLSAQTLLDGESVLQQRLRRMTEAKIGATRIRCHGDYHLGQVLYTGRDLVIIDFEGEPARSLGERRLKRSALTDVAGMIRSFHYAAYGSLTTPIGPAIRPEDVPVLEPWTRFWYTWTAATFLRGYFSVAGGEAFVPHERAELEILLEGLLIDKATYELAYELNNRPDWVTIPIRGILQLSRP